MEVPKRSEKKPHKEGEEEEKRRGWHGALNDFQARFTFAETTIVVYLYYVHYTALNIIDHAKKVLAK